MTTYGAKPEIHSAPERYALSTASTPASSRARAAHAAEAAARERALARAAAVERDLLGVLARAHEQVAEVGLGLRLARLEPLEPRAEHADDERDVRRAVREAEGDEPRARAVQHRAEGGDLDDAQRDLDEQVDDAGDEPEHVARDALVGVVDRGRGAAVALDEEALRATAAAPPPPSSAACSRSASRARAAEPAQLEVRSWPRRRRRRREQRRRPPLRRVGGARGAAAAAAARRARAASSAERARARVGARAGRARGESRTSSGGAEEGRARRRNAPLEREERRAAKYAPSSSSTSVSRQPTLSRLVAYASTAIGGR